MDNKKFLHCLRIQIFPDKFADERIANIVECSKKYGFGNVMLFINAEEYNLGHMTVAEAKKYVETMKKAKAALEKEGITVSLNSWMELGHVDRCHTLKEGQNFTVMTDHNGKKASITACPLCENWWGYFSEFYSYLLSELTPDTVWIEDDFRLHNHGELSYGGCFCPLHMAEYSRHMGEEMSREQFTERLFSGDERAKTAWLDVNRECMVSLARKIGALVKSVSPSTRVGLMSSSPENHASEGRDWEGIHRGLAAGGEMINRIHLPYTNEVSAKSYFRRFNALSTVVRTLIPDECKVYPEIENAVFSTFAKDAEMLRFQVESAAVLGISGMTYDIYDFVGNGVVESFGYGEALRDITPYLDALTALELHPKAQRGIVIPIDERSSYNRKNISSFKDLKPDEYGFGSYLFSLGLSCRYSTEKEFNGEIVALSRGSVNNFTDGALRKLFAENKIILEGGAVLALFERGLSDLIGAEKAELMRPEVDPYSFEGARDGVTVGGIRGRRVSAFKNSGEYVKVTYKKEPKILTDLYTYSGELFGNGTAEGEGFYIIPYVTGSTVPWEQYNELRALLLEDFVGRNASEAVISGYAGVYPYLYHREERLLMVVNSTERSFEAIELELVGIDVTHAEAIDRRSGERVKVGVTKKEGKTSFDIPLPTLTTALIVLK